MSEFSIKVDASRAYIVGESKTGDIFVPPGWTIHTYQEPADNPTWNIPPIICEMDEEQAKEIRETIAKSIRSAMAARERADGMI